MLRPKKKPYKQTSCFSTSRVSFLYLFKLCCLLPFSMLPVLHHSSPKQSWGIEDYRLLCPFEDFDWQGWSRTLSKPTACKEKVVGADISPKQDEDMLIMFITYLADHVVSVTTSCLSVQKARLMLKRFKKSLWLRLTLACFVQRTKRKYLHVCLCQAHVKKSWW